MGQARRAWGRGTGGGGEDGQMLILLVGLVVLILMVLGLGWDTSNWFLGHRALANLADGAAVAAASEVDVAEFYRSEGRDTRLVEAAAGGTVRRFLAASGRDSGVRGVRVAAVRVAQAGRAGAGPSVTVELLAPSQVLFLGWLGLVPRAMSASATATATPRPA
jgi:uncharacterized membrane protein